MSRRVAAAVLLGTSSLLLAAAWLPGSSSAAAVSRPVFNAPVIVDSDPNHTAGEPSIEVSPDGTIYIAAPTGLGARTVAPSALDGGDLLWRSDDGGKTWTYLAAYDDAVGGGDADIQAMSDNTLVASGLSLACITVATSNDKGVTWVPNPVACGSDGGLDDRNWTAAYGTETHSIYTAFGGVQRGLVVNKSLVASPVFVAGPNVPVDPSQDYQWPGVLTTDPRSGAVYLVWQTVGSPNDCDSTSTGCAPTSASKTTPDLIKISKLQESNFSGLTPTAPAPITIATRAFDTFDAFVDVDVAPDDGTVYVVWNERHPAEQETWSMLSRSKDAGQTWSTPVRVNTAPTTAFPWVTAGEGGRLAVSYYGTSAKGFSPEVVNGDWRVLSAYSTDGGATFDEQTVTPNPVHQGAVCTSGTGCNSGTRDLLDFFETDMTQDGCLVLTWTDNARDVVSSTGARTTDNPELIAFGRQISGPGLKAGAACGGNVTTGGGGGAGSGSGGSGSGGTAGGSSNSGDLATTGLNRALPALAIVALATAAWVRRRAPAS